MYNFFFSGENTGEEGGERVTETPPEAVEEDGDAGDDKKKKKKKKSKVGKGAAKEQTNPPTVPIADLFPDGKTYSILVFQWSISTVSVIYY